MSNRKNQIGAVNAWMITAISFIAIAVITGIAATWALLHYLDEKKHIDTTVQTAVSKAQKDQADADEVKFEARENDPNREFVGPNDYGSLSFNYSKLWSVYVNKDGSGGGGAVYEAYLNPKEVPPVSNKTQYALRVVIKQIDYDKEVSSYDRAVEEGDLKSSSATINGQPATRLDGKFSDDIRGSAVIFKIRDKTVTVRTDANTFKEKFNALIKTIKFNS